MGERRTGQRCRAFSLEIVSAPADKFWSGRRGSNPRPSAWEADALPLSYSRSCEATPYYSSGRSARQQPLGVLGAAVSAGSPVYGKISSVPQLTQDQQSFLAEPNIAVLATVDRRGRAHAAPVWYLYDDGVIIISTGRGSQKHRNIEANPEISVVVDRRALPYYALMVQGTAEIGPVFSDADRLRLAVRYLGEDLGRRYVERTAAEDSVTIRLRPRKIIEFNGRAGR